MKDRAADKAKTEETEHVQKTEHAPSDPAPDQTPGGPTCLATEQSDPGQTDNTDWRADLLAYLLHEVLPEDRNAARRVAQWAQTFIVIDDELYKRSPSEIGILMKCIPIAQGKELLLEIHAGICGHHTAPRSLVGKAFRQGFYWPTALRNAEDIVRACKGCQFYAKQTHLPAQALQTIPITWSFAVWGLDMVGPLKKAPGGFTHLLVAIDRGKTNHHNRLQGGR